MQRMPSTKVRAVRATAGFLDIKRRREDEAQQERGDHGQCRQDRRIGKPVQQQAAFGPDDAEIADHAMASAATCRRSIQRCRETRAKTIGT